MRKFNYKRNKKIILNLISFSFILLAISCNFNSSKQESISNLSEINEPILDIDSNFYEFIYHFATEEKLQLKRTKISNWKYFNFFEGYEYTTHEINKEKSDNEFFKKDEILVRTLVLIELKTNIRTEFNFKKHKNIWILENKIESNFEKNKVVDFETFLYKFSKDSVYSQSHVKFPFKYTSLDEDYESKSEFIDTVIPSDFFHEDKFLYFKDNTNKAEKTKTLWMRGIENGIMVLYCFQKINGEWKLIEENDSST